MSGSIGIKQHVGSFFSIFQSHILPIGNTKAHGILLLLIGMAAVCLHRIQILHYAVANARYFLIIVIRKLIGFLSHDHLYPFLGIR